MKIAQEDGEGRGFRAGGEKRRDRRGRALVDVRRPDLERRGGDLEAEADEHQRRRQAHAEPARRASGADDSAADRGRDWCDPVTP